MIAKKIQELKPSATMEINRKAKEMKAGGADVINLSVGEPDFDTPDPVKDFAIEQIRAGFTKYTEAKGILDLRKIISETMKTEQNLNYTPDEIVVSNGAKHSLSNLITALLDPGDEVIIPAPYWVSYPPMVSIAGGVPVICRYDKNFKPDIEHLKSLVNSKTKALILNTPSNPSGVVLERDDLEEIADILLKNNILCISDEVYEKIIYDGKKHYSIASVSEKMKEKTVVVNAVSKTFAMTGWRIGYLAADRKIADAVGKIQGQTASAPCSISQKAAYFAIKENGKLYKKMVEEFEKRRTFLVENMPSGFSFPVPMGAFYLFTSYKNFNSVALSKELLEKQFLAVVPGEDFGADDFIRISYATSMENLEKTVERLNAFTKEN